MPQHRGRPPAAPAASRVLIQRVHSRSQGALVLSSLRKRGLSCGGTSSAFMNAAHCASSSWKTRRSARVSKAADRLLSSRNSLTVLLLTAAARCRVRLAVGVIRRSTRSDLGSVLSGMVGAFMRIRWNLQIYYPYIVRTIRAGDGEGELSLCFQHRSGDEHA